MTNFSILKLMTIQFYDGSFYSFMDCESYLRSQAKSLTWGNTHIIGNLFQSYYTRLLVNNDPHEFKERIEGMSRNIQYPSTNYTIRYMRCSNITYNTSGKSLAQ